MQKYENADMSKYSSFKCGGKAKVLYIPETIDELTNLLKKLKNEEHFIIGNGTNILVRDKGYNGSIIKIGDNFNTVEVKNNTIEVEAGTLLSTIAKKALDNELTGFEFASGIPGSFGGAVYMNAGAYGGEMKDVITNVTVLTKEGNLKTYKNKDLKFDYRYSIIKETNEIVLKGTIKLQKGSKEEIKTIMAELNQKRREKQPINYPSAGSTFKRPEGYFAGKLIEDAGLKGKMIGGAKVSKLHAGFVINKNNATATDVEKLINLIQDEVYKQFKVQLTPEVIIIGDK